MSAKTGPLRPHEERLNYARREPKEPPPGEPGLGDSFLIVTEGEVTEQMYFESLRETLEVNPVTVRVVHPSCTDAEGLVRAAMEERDVAVERRTRWQAGNTGMPGYDHVWVLFDTDGSASAADSSLEVELSHEHNPLQPRLPGFARSYSGGMASGALRTARGNGACSAAAGWQHTQKRGHPHFSLRPPPSLGEG